MTNTDQMNILVACEESGVVRDSFIQKGHHAVSCDLIPSSSGNDNPHIVDDALETIRSQKWDMLIAFPPCTYLCSSGLHWNKRRPERAILTDKAFEFFMAIANADCDRIAIENPIGCVSTRWRKPDQIVQPWMFGHGETKATCLWLKGLPKLTPTDLVEGREQRIWKMPPSKDRSKLRSKTYTGIALAMAEQWG